MAKLLKDKVAIITGGSRGIGRACCLAFAREGASIVFTYNKSLDEAKELQTKIKALKVECLAMQADVRDFGQCQQVIQKTLKNLKKIDILVNNAGIIRDKALAMMLEADFKDVVDTNLGGCFNMSRAAIISLLKQKSGSIVNISSITGIVGAPRQTNYAATKAGIIGFTKALAREVAGYNIRVNAVCPGYIDTDMVKSVHESIRTALLKMIPFQRIGKPEEVAEVCLFLASDKASYITGEAIKIDGGLAA
ncbi:MAG: 3-oxoacyl-[acyl-carrier-protein] reductase [Candidatus Omnitrophica bacterium]|nr:3-oxoacyl-[acyl-carrier-protein] reductase [Candidatus Omnitrophota bacterium]